MSQGSELCLGAGKGKERESSRASGESAALGHLALSQ